MQIHLPSAVIGGTVFVLLGMQVDVQPRRLPWTAEQAEILSHLSIVYLDDGSGNAVNKTIRLSGANLQVVNGLDETETVNGVGNLIVGYNEPYGSQDDRTGSHCVVVGRALSYSSYGGEVLGYRNKIEAEYASALGGWRNEAVGPYALIAGGNFSYVPGEAASVFGGHNNFAGGPWATVAGGHINTASGSESTITGGWLNVATGTFSSVSGGKSNNAAGYGATIAGGERNTATGDFSAVSGGADNQTLHLDSTIGGGCSNLTDAACDIVP